MQRALFVGYTNDSIVTAQQDPFLYYKRALKQELDLSVSIRNVSSFTEAVILCLGERSDIFFLMPDWREQPEVVEARIQNLRQQRPHAKLFFVDPFAQAGSRFLGVLPYVDGFVKRQRYQDLSLYSQDMQGGSLLTQYLAQQQHYELGNWHVGSAAPREYESRIRTGWSLGTSKSFKKILHRPQWLSWLQPKTVDVFCRMSLSQEKDSWYYKYRLSALNALDPLRSDYRVASNGGSDRSKEVSKRQYFRELQQSRIVFSPFGWGETCWRDFEAVCYNCLLLKPSMEHLVVEPNLFIPGETYVPIAWDFSDLEKQCRYYLENPEAAERIVQNAREAYLNYFKTKSFVTQIKQLIQESSGKTSLEDQVTTLP
jgi:hypothetical protein